MISATIIAAALALAFFIARVLYRDYQAQQRSARQRKCRAWIGWKLRVNSSVELYEAQCAFRLLMEDPEWDARGPWEWEQVSVIHYELEDGAGCACKPGFLINDGTGFTTDPEKATCPECRRATQSARLARELWPHDKGMWH